MRTRAGRFGAAFAAAVVLSFLRFQPAAAQESPSFVMERITLAAGSQTVASPSFEATVTLGQEGPAGAASLCNASWTDSLGFWSLKGDLPVPVVLTVAPHPADPQGVVLSWSGNAPQFQVYRGFTPASLVAPGNLEETTNVCSASDPNAGPIAALYYDVEEAPPTPVP
jgi:hypothetical protein